MAGSLDELETFVSIARLGSFTAAAKSLGRSQPAISRRIVQLEDSLGARLLERVGRSARPTEAGRALLPHAEAALAAVRDGEQAVRDAAGVGPQRLRVALVGTLADSHLVDTLREFETRFEGASVELRTATSREVSALVRSGEFDLGLRYFADGDPRLDSIPLGREDLVVVVHAGHPIRRRRIRDLRKLEGERWLGFAPERGQPDSFGRLLERVLVGAGFADPSFTAVDSLTAQKRLVEAGLGVALVPESSVREELAIGSLRSIAVDRLRPQLPVVAVRRKACASAAASAFVDLLRELTPGLRAPPRARPPAGPGARDRSP